MANRMNKNMELRPGGEGKSALDLFLEELKSRWNIDTSDAERERLNHAVHWGEEETINALESYLQNVLNHLQASDPSDEEKLGDGEDIEAEELSSLTDPAFLLNADEEEIAESIQELVEMGHFQKAWEVVEAALQYRSYSAELLWWKSNLLAARGLFDQAETVLESALSLSPEDDRIEATYIELLIIQGRFDEAHMRLEDNREKGELGPEMAMVRVVYYLVRQQWEHLIEAFEEGVTLHPNLEQWSELAVIVYKTTRAWQHGFQLFQALHQRYPEITPPLVAAGNLYLIQKQWENARKCYEKALNRDPTLGELYLRISLVAIQQGRKQEALDYLHKAREWGWDWNSVNSYGFSIFIDQALTRFLGGSWNDLFDTSENNDTSNE